MGGEGRRKQFRCRQGYARRRAENIQRTSARVEAPERAIDARKRGRWCWIGASVTGFLPDPILSLLLLIPASVCFKRVAGKDAIGSMDDDDQREYDRYPNEYMLPVHSTPQEVKS